MRKETWKMFIVYYFIDRFASFKMFDFNNCRTVLIGEFHNFATEIAQGSIEKVFDNESEQVGGFSGWYVHIQNYNLHFIKTFRKLTLQKASDSGGTFIVPSFSWPKWYFFSILNVRILINPLNHLNSENKEFKYADRFYYEMGSSIEGKKMYLSEILDEKNGWLDNGTFTVKVGFYVESMLDKQECWRFNFLNDPFQMKSDFDSVNLFRENTIRRVLKLHCKNLDEKLTAENGIHGISDFGWTKACLDILHGVQLKYPDDINARILKIAKFLEFSNVIRYIELQFIEDPRGYKEIGDRIFLAIQSNFNRLLIRLLEKLEDLSVLEEVMKKVDIEKMSGESMKICMKKLLYGKE
ncbi:hypothetical protein CAEBREN_11734 [Caenorhabditis brenneri]|uniref:Uncharacterized protein n=1 Tax=Caenorhabditis brenneri TaxID=135651 RepID=G0P3F4_CAEBE|nr:hypothetical protein CAEBREN_11734 [Caenorhabditis brenneri]